MTVYKDETVDIVLDENGYFHHEDKQTTWGVKIDLHYTILGVDFGDKIDPSQDKGWNFELDCSCNNQHKEKRDVPTGQEWKCSVDTNGMGHDTTFKFKCTAITGPDMGRAIVTLHYLCKD